MGRRTILLVAALGVAALGTLLVFLYANNANDRAQADNDPINVLVAKTTVSTGTSGSAAQSSGAFVTKSVPRSAVAPGAVSVVTPIADQVALSPIYAGQQILAQQFGETSETASVSSLPIPTGKLAVSVQLGDPARVAGFVQPGSKVAVFVTMQSRGADDQKSVRLLIPSVQVIAAGPTTLVSAVTSKSSDGSNTEELPKALLTLAVDQKQAEKLILGQTEGGLYFGLLNDSSKVTPTGGTLTTNLFG